MPRSPRLLCLAVSTVVLMLAVRPAHAVFTNGRLQVVHLDAGQGDAAVIITPGGQVALIDEGTNFTAGTSPPSCARVLSELQALGVNHVDLHFASHYHADHIGCITALTGITIDAGWDRAQSYSSAAYTSYVNYLGAKRHTLTKGQVFTLDSLSAHPVTITCVALGGDGITTSDENAKCLILKVSYGNFDEVFGGDLAGYPSGTSSSNTNIETKVGPQVGPVEVYKVHHHGSAYGSYDDWLNATKPKVGIVSAGTGNAYGHPTAAALTRLHNHGVRTYWTEQGSGVAPNPAWDKVANGMIRIYAVWQPGGVDSVLASGIADTLTNSGTALDQTAPLVAILSPNGGETVAAGSVAAVTWSASDNVGVATVDVDVSTDGGTNWSNVATGVANSGSTPWNVPNTPTVAALARVTAHDASGNSATAASASDFTIADQTSPLVTLTSPNGGEHYLSYTYQSVTWTASDNVGVDSVNVDLSLHGAAGPWQPIEHGLSNTGSVSWTVPNAATDSAAILVTAFDHAQNQGGDPSDGVFQIEQDLTAAESAAPRFALHPAIPSPTRGKTRLQFSLAVAGPVQLDVIDLAGRRVWSMAEPALEAGEHSIVWPGLRDGGSPAGTGIYFVRLASREKSMTIKLVLLR
jgi:beta-lactamase superfamily II metal-dependent hydrolase